MQYRFNKYLEHYIIRAKKDGRIAEINFNVPGVLEADLQQFIRLDQIHTGIYDFYKNSCDGYGFEWSANKDEGVGGNIQLAETKYLFADTESFDFYDEDKNDEDDIKFFHPFDYPSAESYVGFVIKPDTIYKSVYYMGIGDYELNNLDLDFEGYTQMAIEARVFNHWQVVLLYYMGDINIGSSETETFKTEMPKIFPDWSWEDFIAKFESLRLSKRA